VPFRFSYRPYAAPFRARVRTAHGLWTEREGVLVRVEDPEGRFGFGEAAPLPWFGTETNEALVSACSQLADRWMETVDSVPADFGCLRGALREGLAHLARNTQASTGSEELVTAAETGRDYWPVAALLPSGRSALAVVEDLAESGFRTFKWKVGVGDVLDELGILDDLIARLPTGSKLRLDANGGWDRKKSERWLDRCAERPIEFVEQPISPDVRSAEDLLRGLAEDFPTPIGLDESIATDAQVHRWLGSGW